VDFWDITKLLVRRWRIVLPMLVLAGALAAIAVSQVKPDYVATAHVQLVPPVIGQTKPGQATADQRNPWIGLGLQTIGNAAVVTVTDLSVARELEASGLSDSYTVTMAQTSPLITFEIVGNSPEQARRTADRLIERFSGSVASLQSSYGVSAADSITSRRLDQGASVEKSTSKVKRALVAVAGAGLLATVAGTVGFDAWLRRPPRQRTAAKPVPAAPPRRVAALATNGNGATRPEPYRLTMANPANGVPAESNSDLTQPISRPSSGEPAEAERPAEPALAVSSDATIVLPRIGGPRPVARPEQRE
jgi:capsular polysaccharide biosynthesis protein